MSSSELSAGFLRPLRDNGLAAVDVTAIYFTRSPHVIPTGPVRFLVELAADVDWDSMC